MKTIYNISIRIMQISFAFWLLETIFFLFLYGWHWTASGKAEQTCDNVAVWGGIVGFFGWMWCASKVLDAIMEAADFEPRKPFNP